MKALKIILLVLSYVLIILCSIWLTKKIYHPENDDPHYVVPDTTYSVNPFKPELKYKYNELPKYVVIYPESQLPNIDINLSNGNIIHISESYLSEYQTSQKLVQLLLKNNDLSLTLQNTTGLVHTDTYEIYPELYWYNFQENSLTYKKFPLFKRFQPYTELEVRPIHNQLDVNLGLLYKTRKIHYETGLNVYYYPNLKANPGFDVYFKIRYLL